MPIEKSLTQAERQTVRRILRTEVADPHVHCGLNPFGFGSGLQVTSDFHLYRQKMIGLNIVRAILIPEPTYEVRLADGGVERLCVWEDSGNGRVSYKRITTRDSEIREEDNPSNPYVTWNRSVLQTTIDANRRSSGRKLYFAPLVHPKLDSKSSLEEFSVHELTAALKVHGISTHCGPADMPRWVINLAKRSDLPFILHTDYVS
jgi:hypothetical protein